MMRAIATALPFGTAVLLASWGANAHISVTNPAGFADQTQEIVFGVGHGCEGSDTLSVRIEVPPEVVSVRALGSEFGPATVERNDAGLVSAVTWEKPQESVLDTDSNYYKLTLRLKVPNQPFTTLFFPAYQVCQASDGSTLRVDWVSTETNEAESEVGPAPALKILPKRFAGWNKFTLPEDVVDLSLFFADALIVWKGNAAYSANPNTAELIAGTPDTSELTSLEAGDEVWVKY